MNTLLWERRGTASRFTPLALSMENMPAVLPSVRIKLAAEPKTSAISRSASRRTPCGQERLSEKDNSVMSHPPALCPGV